MSSDLVILIPARLGSTRLKEKLIADVGGKSMIRRVWEQATDVGIKTVIVTDSNKIAEASRRQNENYHFQPEYIRVDDDVWCGCARCAKGLMDHWGVNIGPKNGDLFKDLKGVIIWQGDELVHAQVVADFVKECVKHKWSAANLLFPPSDQEIEDRDQVKALCSPLNSTKNHQTVGYFHRLNKRTSYTFTQIGIYYFTPTTLINHFLLPASTLPLATAAELNQIIAHHNGVVWGWVPDPITYLGRPLRGKLDTSEDLQSLRRVIESCPQFPFKGG